MVPHHCPPPPVLEIILLDVDVRLFAYHCISYFLLFPLQAELIAAAGMLSKGAKVVRLLSRKGQVRFWLSPSPLFSLPWNFDILLWCSTVLLCYYWMQGCGTFKDCRTTTFNMMASSPTDRMRNWLEHWPHCIRFGSCRHWLQYCMYFSARSFAF